MRDGMAMRDRRVLLMSDSFEWCSYCMVRQPLDLTIVLFAGVNGDSSAVAAS